MILARTKLLEKWCDEMSKLAQNRAKRVLDETFKDTVIVSLPNGTHDEIDAYPQLTTEEIDECRQVLHQCYSNFERRLSQIHIKWASIFDLLIECSRLKYNYKWNSIFYNPRSLKDDQLELISIEIKNFIYNLTSSLNFTSILTGSGDWCWDDLVAIQDDEIIARLESCTGGRTLFEKIKYLTSFKTKLNELEKKHEYLQYFVFDQLRLNNRNLVLINREIDKLIFRATPHYELKSKEQIKILRKAFLQVDEELPYSVSTRLDFMIDNNKVIVTESSENIPKDPWFELPKKAKPSDIIRTLLSKISYLNNSYQADSLELKLWLYYLLMDVEGFSLNHILNAPNRSSKRNKSILQKQP